MRRITNLLPLIVVVLAIAIVLSLQLARSGRGHRVETLRARLAGLNAQPEEDWLFAKRTYPRFEFPDRVSEKIQQSTAAFRKGERHDTPMAVAPWTLAGPTNIGGRITGVAIHPTDPNLFYAGAATGGVWKTTDFGATWTNVFNESFSIGAVTLDPSDPSVVYVGTGESNPSSVDTYPGNGLWRSTDAGATWTNLGLAETGHIAKVAVNPLNPNTIFVAAFGLYRTKNVDKGVYRSFDRGASWTRVLQVDSISGATDLQFDPDDTSRVLVATHTYYRTLPTVQRGGAGSGLWYTTNAGTAWTQVTAGFPFNDPNIGSISLDFSKSSPSIVYATVANGGGLNWDGVYKSFDNGETWSEVFNNLSFGESQVWYNNILRVHPTDPNLVWTGMTNMYRSTDGGTSFGFASISGNYHVDHHVIEYAPSNANRMVFGNDGGIFTSTDGGASWVHAGNLPITQFYAGTIALQSVNYLMGGAQDNSTMRTRSAIDNDWTVIYGGDGFNTAVDPSDSNFIYAESQNGGLVRSTNGGANWATGTSGINFGEPVNWQMPYVLNPQNPKTLYTGTNYLYRSTDGAASWTKISPILTYNLGGFFSTLSTIDVSPLDSNIVYVGTGDGRLWVTTDGGSNWADIAAGLPLRWVSRVTADLTDPGVAYVTLSGFREYDNEGHIYRTSDNGGSWTDIGTTLPDVPLNDVLVDPDFPSMLYIASDIGVMVSTDLGSSWADFGTGLPAVTVHDLSIHAPTRTIAAFTHGRSVYTNTLPLPAGESVDVEVFPRWNLVSTPIDTGGLPVLYDYPEAVSNAFAFDSSGYQAADSLVPGTGYWLKFPNSPSTPVTISGVPLTLDTIPVRAGWNIVGSIGTPIAVSTIGSDPPGLVASQFFGYNAGYSNVSTIVPGKGYWVKASVDGALILSSSGASPSNRIVIVESAEMPPAPPDAAIAGDGIPRAFTLAQNYPNPFNPSTTIGYTLPAAAAVRLVVTNLIGQEIAVLAEGVVEAGTHEARFDASNLPSGLYLCRLTTAGFTGETKMLLMR